jgi:hypothetical protein
MSETNAPTWFPFFGGYPIEISADRVVFRVARTREIAFIMTLNEYNYFLSLDTVMKRGALMEKALEETEKR